MLQRKRSIGKKIQRKKFFNWSGQLKLAYHALESMFLKGVIMTKSPKSPSASFQHRYFLSSLLCKHLCVTLDFSKLANKKM